MHLSGATSQLEKRVFATFSTGGTIPQAEKGTENGKNSLIRVVTNLAI